MKRVLSAESAGFCFGVSRSVELAEAVLDEQGSAFCLGELMHNRDEVLRLTERGLRVVESAEEIPDGATVIIRSHGVAENVYRTLSDKNARVVDATCPKVSRIHNLVRKAGEQGRMVFIIGAA